MNKYKIITITHKSAKICHIGRYIPTFNEEKAHLAEHLHTIRKIMNVEELLYLATCNRLTFLMVTDEVINKNFKERLFHSLHPDADEEKIQSICDVAEVYEGEECIRHIFRVASSLDSLVIGEREISRQLRQAYDYCRKNQLTGDDIRVLIEAAVPLSKEVYTHTDIGKNSVSVVSLAMQEMQKHHLPKDARFLIVGAGQTNNLVAKFLNKKEYSDFKVFNRSINNAKILAKKLGNEEEAYTLEDLKQYKDGFDVMVVCTSAAKPIINPKLYKQLLGGDDKNEKILIDLAVPNNIDRKVVEQYNTHYIEVEKLRLLAEENKKQRELEAHKANIIVEERICEFAFIHQQRRLEREMTQHIPSTVRSLKEMAIDSEFNDEIAGMGEYARTTLDKILAYVEKKYIGIPMRKGRQALEQLKKEEEQEKTTIRTEVPAAMGMV